jgi:hypothetical protein
VTLDIHGSVSLELEKQTAGNCHNRPITTLSHKQYFGQNLSCLLGNAAIVTIGISSQFANLMELQGPSASDEFLFAVSAIGDHVP